MPGKERGARWRRIGAMLAAAAFVLLVPGSGQDRASAPAKDSGLVGPIAYTVELAGVTPSAASTAVHSHRGHAIALGHCCVGGDSVCQNGCYSACSAADLADVRIQCPEELSDYRLATQGNIFSSKPPPHFRPPRVSA